MLVMIINRTDDVRMLIDRNRLILIACVCGCYYYLSTNQ
jgi:hypothetical protein